MMTFRTTMPLWECGAACRNLLRRPGFLILSTLTSALGVGACSLTFSLIENFVLTPPPYADPARLAVIGPADPSGLTTASPHQYQAILGLREFECAGAASFQRLSNLRVVGNPVLAPSRPVSRSFLESIGVRPAVGRNFTDEEDRAPGSNVAIISDRLWTSQFGRDPNIVGRSMKLEGKEVSVIGVLPPDFEFMGALDVLTPLALPPASVDDGNFLMVVARLAPSISFTMAGRAATSRIDSRAAELGIRTDKHQAFSAAPLWAGLAASGRPTVTMFFAFGLCVLVLASANIINLLSMRAIARAGESAVRRALGADPIRCVAPAIAEALLIAVCAVGCSLALAGLGLRAIASYIPADWLNAGRQLWLGPRTLGLALALGIGIPVLSATIAARAALRQRAGAPLLSAQRAGWSPAVRAVGKSLVILQVALASGLLVLVASFAALLSTLLNTDLGLRSDRVVTFTIAGSETQYPDAASLRGLAGNLVRGLETISDSRGAAASWNEPVGQPFRVPVRLPDGRDLQVQFRPVSAGYFDVLQIPLLQGRRFNDLDGNTAEAVAIVNGAFASRHLAGQPLDQRIRLGSDPLEIAMRVVGVVGDTRQSGPASPAEPILYIPLFQTPDVLVSEMRQFLGLHFFLRGSESSASRVIEVLRRRAPDEVVAGLGMLSSDLRRLSAAPELSLKCLGAMAALAMLVAIGGLYSVMSVSVASRKRDMSIKAALGATPGMVVLEILGAAARQVAAGLMVGVAGGMLALQYLRSVVPGLEPAPPVLVTGVIALLFSVGMCACLAPALHAARVDPRIALCVQ
jgi:predicted permease